VLCVKMRSEAMHSYYTKRDRNGYRKARIITRQ
jgi:hypothetical protein